MNVLVNIFLSMQNCWETIVSIKISTMSTEWNMLVYLKKLGLYEFHKSAYISCLRELMTSL